MPIHLKPEIKALIDEDVKRGPYASREDFVEEAVRQLHAQEEWMAENREEIAAKIEEGYASVEREGFLSADEAKARLDQTKRDWITSHRG